MTVGDVKNHSVNEGIQLLGKGYHRASQHLFFANLHSESKGQIYNQVDSILKLIWPLKVLWEMTP